MIESSILLETLLLFFFRIIYYFICRHFVKVSLLSDLKSVIQQDSGNLLDSDSSFDSPNNTSTGGLTQNELELDEAEQGYFPTSTSATSSSSNSSSINNGNSSGSTLIGSPIRAGRAKKNSANEFNTTSASNNFNNGIGINLDESSFTTTTTSKRSKNHFYTRLSTIIFCLSFSESCMLFSLVLFGEIVGAKARMFNWSISLMALLSLIVFIIPLFLCLLLTHRTQSVPASRTLILTLIPFTIYLFLFYQVGYMIASHSVLEGGSNSFSLVNSLLSRVCVPGVFLIATLSGGGAVNTAWLAWERRSISNIPVTDEEIRYTETSLFRARMDINSRNKSLKTAKIQAEEELKTSANSSILTRWTQSKPAAEQVKFLEIELKSMEEVESEMRRELTEKRKRREIIILGKTAVGKAWLAAGWALSVYCVWRVFISCINLIFGYTQGRPRTSIPSLPPSNSTDIPSTIPIDSNPTQQPTTDILTSLITKLAVTLNLDLDVATWSRLIGLVLIASIILANMRVVLGSISRILKATSTGVSSSFMLLLLAQLMAIYLLTSLISLPSSPTTESESTSTLLETLPAFNVFSRLFDSVFLLAAGTVFGLRFVQRKVRIALE